MRLGRCAGINAFPSIEDADEGDGEERDDEEPADREEVGAHCGCHHRNTEGVEAAAEVGHVLGFGEVVAEAYQLELGYEREADGGLVGAVEGDGQGLAGVATDESAGKGEDGDQAEEEEGEDGGLVGELFGELEDVVLEHPVADGDEEGDDEGEPVVAFDAEGCHELAVRDAGGDFELEDKQRHRDGEDAVGEGFDAVLAVHGGFSVAGWGRAFESGLQPTNLCSART